MRCCFTCSNTIPLIPEGGEFGGVTEIRPDLFLFPGQGGVAHGSLPANDSLPRDQLTVTATFQMNGTDTGHIGKRMRW